jgi:crotonobetainyl-CoA:carnitine CoA-transferase CaiB-like acyl-CoA transferase
MVQVVEHPERGPIEILGNPIRIDHQPSVLTPAPLLGADTENVLCTELGLNASEIGALREACVIGGTA